jgi:predicted RNA-binding Zn-ribbon protein involved in translation (DUF1610 family)
MRAIFMLTANNSKGIRVSATQADKQSKYFCPSCGKEVFLRQCEKKVWHFYHRAACTDTWHYEEKTQWHKDWQDKCCEFICDDPAMTSRDEVISYHEMLCEMVSVKENELGLVYHPMKNFD